MNSNTQLNPAQNTNDTSFAPHAPYIVSSFCGTGECVAVSYAQNGTVRVFNTTSAAGAYVEFTRKEWQDFILGVKNEEFEGLSLKKPIVS